MKKLKVMSAALAVFVAAGVFSGCAVGKKAEKNTEEYGTILTYDGKEVSSKYYSLVADVIKDSYLSSSGYATESVDKANYMTLKHILIQFKKEDGTTRTEEEALNEANRIKGMITDDNFDSLMEEYSEDPGSKSQPNGYTFAHNDGTMMQEFDDGGWALEVGQVSEPVKTSYGYHIIKRVELNEEDLPKSPDEINWDEEKDTSGNKVIDQIRERAYDWVVESAILSKRAADNDMSISDDKYEESLQTTYQAFGGEESAKKHFEKRSMSEDEIKEMVNLVCLSNEYYDDFIKNVDTEALFDEFITSDVYTEMKEYYSQTGQEIDYTEYNADDEMLLSGIQSYAYVKMIDEEKAKVVKNEDIYNSYK